VGYLSAVDPDSPAGHVFDFAKGDGDGDNGGFLIEGNELRLQYEAAADYEADPAAFWSLRIRVTDVTGLQFTAVIQIRVADDRSEDFDQDGLTESAEEDVHGTSDMLYDTDGDGVGDGAEVAIGTSPANPDDWPQTSLLAWGRQRDGELAVPRTGGYGVLAAGQYHSLAMDYQLNVTGWGGRNEYGQLKPPEGLDDVIALAAGGEFWPDDSAHSLALRRDGTVVGWGYDHDGLLVVPDGIGRVVSIAAGRGISIALRDDGTVVTWGRNPMAEIQPPAGLSDVVAVSAGGFRCLALKGDGTLVEWGSNFDGEKWHDAAAPAGLRDIVSISAGRFHSLAARSDGTVVAWGYGANGQTTVPAGLQGVIHVAAGGFHSLALKGDGGVVAWGSNSDGQCNVPVSAQQGVHLIAAGIQHSMAARRNAGYPAIVSSPRITGAPDTLLEHQVQVADAGGAALEFSAIGLPPGLSIHPTSGLISGFVSTAIRRSVRIHVMTPYGLLSQAAWIRVSEGSPPTSITLAPALLEENNPAGTEVGILTVADPDAGDAHSFEWVDGAGSHDNDMFRIEGNRLILIDDLARDFEQDPTDFSIRIRALDPSLNDHEAVITLDFTNDRSEDADGDGLTEEEEGFRLTSDLKKDTDGDGYDDRFEILRGSSPVNGTDGPVGRMLMEWGDAPLAPGATPLEGDDVIAIAAGGAHSIMLQSNGTIFCRGDDGEGQATPPAGLQDVIAVAAGWLHSLALKRDGTVVAWGNNAESQCDVPPGLAGVVAIAAGGFHSLALGQDGRVTAWGCNEQGQSGVPAFLENVVEISAGGFHSLALRHDGSVVAWGTAWRDINKVPDGLTGVTGISAGGYHSLALKHDGTVVAWGDWEEGQTTVPGDLTGVTSIAAGWLHNLAMRADGSVRAWGNLLNGRLEVPPEAAHVRGIAAGVRHNLAICQEAGFPGFPDTLPIRGRPGGSVDNTCAIANSNALGYSAMGLPEDLVLDPLTGRIGGLVVNGRRRATRVMAATDEGVISRVFWINTADGSPPLLLSLSHSSVIENAPMGTAVGSLETIDPDPGDSHVYHLEFTNEGPDSFRFVIEGNQLLTRYRMGADYEAGDPRLFIRVTATDTGGNTYSQDMVLDLLDDRNEDADEDGFNQALEEDVLGTTDLVSGDFATSDTDKDGLTAIIEYAFNMDPLLAGSPVYVVPGGNSIQGLPAVNLMGACPADSRLRLEYIRRVNGSLSYTPQFSSGLAPAGWVDASTRVLVTPIDDTWERCVVEDDVPVSQSSRRFARVAVSSITWVDIDGDGVSRSMEESVFGTSDDVFTDFRTSDTDGDGVPGMIEHAFNLNPKIAGPPLILPPNQMAGMPSITVAADGEGQFRLRIEFIRQTGSLLTYKAQFSSHIAEGNWLSVDESRLEIIATSPGWERCVAWDSEPLLSQSRRFGRVAVSW
jgi:alpha-tubulin suppressor-like RCC1 family protein